MPISCRTLSFLLYRAFGWSEHELTMSCRGILRGLSLLLRDLDCTGDMIDGSDLPKESVFSDWREEYGLMFKQGIQSASQYQLQALVSRSVAYSSAAMPRRLRRNDAEDKPSVRSACGTYTWVSVMTTVILLLYQRRNPHPRREVCTPEVSEHVILELVLRTEDPQHSEPSRSSSPRVWCSITSI